MLSLTFLALSLFSVCDASMHHSRSLRLDYPQALGARSENVLGPVSGFQVANNYIAPDGYNRSAVLVNGIFPAPLIQAQRDDTFAVQVDNRLTDDTMPLETSIHWHGIFQRRSNYADGVPYVTQCPIGQNASFEYTFKVTGQSGTYWYHSHYSNQYCDGLRGPLVIYDSSDPLADLYDVDDESTVITLSDWYHIPSIELGEIFGAITANATLINGRGRYSGGPSVPLSVVNVTHGLRYRLRIVSLSCDPNYNFTIDGHRMTVIEADGNEVVPIEVDSLLIFAGQRYSVVITANQTVGNYWIRALSSATNASFDNGQNMAILRYAGASDEDPATSASYNITLDEVNLHALVNPGAPGVPEIGKADVNIQLAPGFNSSGYFSFNSVPYIDPSVPVLLQILSGATHPTQLLPNGSVYELPFNKTIELSFPNPTNAPGGPHPIHLHGHAFDVVRVAGSNATNFVNPVRRDVVSIGSDSTDNVTIRFTTNNPGPWFLHCHIDWHLHHGFAAVMAEAPNQTITELQPIIPADWYSLCAVAPNQKIPGVLG